MVAERSARKNREICGRAHASAAPENWRYVDGDNFKNDHHTWHNLHKFTPTSVNLCSPRWCPNPGGSDSILAFSAACFVSLFLFVRLEKHAHYFTSRKLKNHMPDRPNRRAAEIWHSHCGGFRASRVVRSPVRVPTEFDQLQRPTPWL